MRFSDIAHTCAQNLLRRNRARFDGARRDRRLLLHRPDDFDWTRHQRAE